MKRLKPTLWGIVGTVLVLILVPLIVLASGAINMGATAGPGALESTFAEFARDRSVDVRAPDRENPYEGDPQALKTGLEHFAATCVICHGAPGVEPNEFAGGLNPPAPALEKAHAEFTDGELFWIAKHGIRMTGMPAFGRTHSDEDLWKIAAFVRHLPDLSAEEREQLKTSRAAGDHGHGDGNGGGHH